MAAPSWNGEILPDSRSYSNMRRKLRQGLQNSDNVGVRPLKCTTSITYQAVVIFIISVGLFGKATSFELHTERSVKVVRGRNTSLDCSFTDPADAVYWYKHNSTGAPVDDADLVAREFLGISDPLPGKERFRITEDYRLLISEVSIADETTYSCYVFLSTGTSNRGYTDLRIIVLADFLGPRIGPCNNFIPGKCTYKVPTDPPEEVLFDCKLDDVRPPVNLTWIRSDDRVMEQASSLPIVEKDGLYEVASILEVPKSGFEYDYLCQATGDAVQNASSTKLTFEEGTVLVSGWSDTSVLGVVVGLVVVIVMIVIAVVLSRWMFLRARAMATKRNRLTLNMVKTDQESSLLDKHDGEQANLKSLQGENVENEHEEERAKFEQEEKQSLESRLKEYELNQKELERVISKQRSQIGEYEENQITLKRNVKELEQKRSRETEKFEEERRLVEFKLRRSVAVVEVLTRENGILRKVMKEAGFQVPSSKRSRSSIPHIPWFSSEKKTESAPWLRTIVDCVLIFKASNYDDHDDNNEVSFDSQLEIYEGASSGIHDSSTLIVLRRNEERIRRLQHLLVSPRSAIIHSLLLLSGSFLDPETEKDSRSKKSD